MNKSSLKIIFICLISIITGCASLTGSQFHFTQQRQKPAHIETHANINKDLLQHAPNPHAKQFNYQQINATSDNPEGYQIDLAATKNKLTHYAISNNLNQPFIKTISVGYGGFLILSQHLVGMQNSRNKYYRDHYFESINDVKGKLFPMKVGNKLQFDYSEIITNAANKQKHTQQTNGRITYQVVGHNNSYHFKDLIVPGKIYIIKRSQSINDAPAKTDSIYYYSPYLGWYVKVEYFINGQPGPIYSLSSYKTSLDLKQIYSAKSRTV